MKNRANRKIFIEEYVSINGIDQYLLHSGTNYNNPVLLFLHGGPGFAESLFAHAFQEKWEEIFTVVYWDQRCAGKTLTRNPNIYPTIDSMLEDLYETVQYLKKKYNKQNVIILGHSWGSVLGTIFTKRYPEEVAYYIGVGQVISLIDNERVGYEKLKELAIKANDKKTLKRLETIGDYPGEKFDRSFMTKCSKVRRIQGKYNLAITMTLSLIKNIFKSPIFKLSDISALFKAAKANEKVLEFLYSFNLNAESTEYKVPMYYILGENDWQTPYVIAQNYFNKISAPSKRLYLIPKAGHGTMVDQPQLFFEALLDVNNKESKNS